VLQVCDFVNHVYQAVFIVLICGDGAEVKVMEAVVVVCLKAVMVVVQMAHSPNDVIKIELYNTDA